MVSITNLMKVNELAKSINEHQMTLRCADKQIQHSVTVNIVLSTFDNAFKLTQQFSSCFPHHLGSVSCTLDPEGKERKGKERKGKEEYLYSGFSHQGTSKALRHGSHSFTCKQHHACLSFVAFTRCHHHSN